VATPFFSVCKAYRSHELWDAFPEDTACPTPVLFTATSVHCRPSQPIRLKGETVSLNTLQGRMRVAVIPTGDHQRKILASGLPEGSGTGGFAQGNGFSILAVWAATGTAERVASGPVMGVVDVGENTLAATKHGPNLGRKRHCAIGVITICPASSPPVHGSQRCGFKKLRQVSGKERRRVKHVNHETSKAILEEARRIGAATIVMEDLTHIRDRLRAGRRMRARLHRWAFPAVAGLCSNTMARCRWDLVVYVNPAYSSQACSACGQLGTRLKHRFECSCGLRAHADLNASRNLARIGETAVFAKGGRKYA